MQVLKAYNTNCYYNWILQNLYEILYCILLVLWTLSLFNFISSFSSHICSQLVYICAVRICLRIRVKKWNSANRKMNFFFPGLGTEIKMNIDINLRINVIHVLNIDINFRYYRNSCLNIDINFCITEIQVLNIDINFDISKFRFWISILISIFRNSDFE